MADLTYWLALVVTILNYATPLLIAAIGVLIVEKSGVLNLGVEGMMIVGAMVGYIAGSYLDTSSCALMGFDGVTCLQWEGTLTIPGYIASFLLAGLAGAALASLFAVMTQMFGANHVATGLGLTILGLTVTNGFGPDAKDMRVESVANLLPDSWVALPTVGRLLGTDLLTVLAFLSAVAALYFLNRTRVGMLVRAAGENHYAAHALGYHVRLIRVGTILFGGFMAGVAGAYISLVQLEAPTWREGMTAGAGWLALALILFSTWRPLRVVLGALLFGLAFSLELRLQSLEWMPSWGVQFVLPSLPYLVPVLVLVIISRNAAMIRANQPGSLAQPFNPSS